jgi:hypothetical protein
MPGGNEAPYFDAMVCFALAGTDHRLDTIEKLPAAVEPRLACGLGRPIAAVRGARLAEGRHKTLLVDLAPWQQQ